MYGHLFGLMAGIIIENSLLQCAWLYLILCSNAMYLVFGATVEIRDCHFEGDDGLFDDGGCQYEVGQTGRVARGITKGMIGEVAVVTEHYLLYRVHLPLEQVLKNGMPETDLYLYAERDGEMQSLRAENEGRGERKLAGLSDQEHVLFTFGGRSKQAIREKIKDCYEEGAQFAFLTKPNGECGQYWEPHPPINTCKETVPGEQRRVKLRDVPYQILYSAVQPRVEGEHLVYQEMPRYEGCDTGMVPYDVGEVLDTYGYDMFTYRRIDYKDIPAEGLIYTSPLDKREDALYFHTFRDISKWHGTEKAREKDGFAYIIDVEAALEKFPQLW